MARFVKASMKGWDYARANPDEAAEIVLENDATGAQTEKHQKRMMGEIDKLTEGSNGALDRRPTTSAPSRSLLVGRLRPGHHQEAGRRLDPRGLRGDGKNVTARSNQSANGSSPSGEEEPDNAAEPHIVSYTWLELAALPDTTDWERLNPDDGRGDRSGGPRRSGCRSDHRRELLEERNRHRALASGNGSRSRSTKRFLTGSAHSAGSYDWRINTVLRAFMEQHRDGLSEREAGVPPGLRRYMQDRDRSA